MSYFNILRSEIQQRGSGCNLVEQFDINIVLIVNFVPTIMPKEQEGCRQHTRDEKEGPQSGSRRAVHVSSLTLRKAPAANGRRACRRIR